ncbi:MAG TPA: 5-deoxy-glucuronate isomerase, partial [Acidimicrobiia bacterium]|nr:5-deoxy-glucuronate isomerase [Acidimicrobiia bacterium]
MRTITPQGSAYRGDAVQLDLPTVEPGETATICASDGVEAAVVLLAGDVTFAEHRACRVDVFDQAATAVYLPPGTAITVQAHTHTELAFAATVDGALRAPHDAAPVIVTPTDVVITGRGRPGWQRDVHDVIADAVPAQRLLVGETFNATGEWSSFPPHKHDGGDGEPALEEVYYYRFDRPDGFGFQGLYEH